MNYLKHWFIHGNNAEEFPLPQSILQQRLHFGWFFSRTYGYLSIEARDLSVHTVNFSNFSSAVSAKNRNQLSKESDEIQCEISLLGKRTTSKLSRCPLFTWAGANSKVTLQMKNSYFLLNVSQPQVMLMQKHNMGRGNNCNSSLVSRTYYEEDNWAFSLIWNWHVVERWRVSTCANHNGFFSPGSFTLCCLQVYFQFCVRNV